MIRTLSCIKKLSEKLSGIPSIEEYRTLKKLQERIEDYEEELSEGNFLLNREHALLKLSLILSKANIPMPYCGENNCLSSTLLFSEESNDRIELFVLFPPKKSIIIALCVYELKKALPNPDEPDFLDEFGKSYGVLYGKMKLTQCDWCNPAPQRTETLVKIISTIESQMKLFFKKAEEGLYTLSIPTINSVSDFRSQVMPKLKGIYEILISQPSHN